MQNNALLFMYYVKNNYPTVTLNAISAIIGNIEKESTINSGRHEGDNTSTTSKGLGFIQWTPYPAGSTNPLVTAWNNSSYRWHTYTVRNDMYDPEWQIDLIMAELGNNSPSVSGYWINRSGGYNGLSGSWYPYLSKSAFLTSTKSAYDLGLVYHGCREGSADGTTKLKARGDCCQKWYDFLLPYWNGTTKTKEVSETTTGEEIPLESDDTDKTETTGKNKILKCYMKRNTYKFK